MRQHSPSAGFTLIELLISVTIMALMVGGGVAAFITFNQRQGVQAAGQELKTYLRTAQQKASASDKPASCTGRLEGYRLSLLAGSSTVTLAAVCSDGVHLTNTYTLSNQVINTSGQVTSVDFFSLHGGTNANPTQNFAVGREGVVYDLIVSKGGEVRDVGIRSNSGPQGGSAPSPSPSTALTPSPSPSPSASPSPSPSPSPSAQPSPLPSGDSPRPSGGGGGGGIDPPGGNPTF